MRSIFRNLKPQWKTVVLILLCLTVKAVCDLSLPTYTSSLIDVGIQNSGVEYAVPMAIRCESYDAVAEHMTADEQALWQDSYEANGDVYTRKDGVDEKTLNEVFTAPIAQAALAARGDDSFASAALFLFACTVITPVKTNGKASTTAVQMIITGFSVVRVSRLCSPR